MNMGDVLLWVIFPYTSLSIFMMSIIWQYDDRFQEDKTNSSYQLKKSTVIILNLSLFGFVISGLSLIIQHSALAISSFTVNWMIGLVTLNPNMGMISEHPVLLAFHLFCAFFLLTMCFHYRRQLVNVFGLYRSTFRIKKSISKNLITVRESG